MSNRAVLYLRRSIATDGDPRIVSLDVQRDACLRYTDGVALEPVHTITDDGVSGGDRERFQRIVEAVKLHRARAVVVYHIDRFGRDIAGSINAIRELSKAKVDLHVAGRGIVEADTPSGFLAVGIEALVAEHARLIASEKIRAALKHRRDRGELWSKSPPFGYRAQGRSLIPDLTEQRALARTRTLRAANVPWREIPKVLAGEKLLSRVGTPISVATLRRALAPGAFSTDAARESA
jgi:DNA invertase Pin-like site-specific DNA recombinase